MFKDRGGYSCTVRGCRGPYKGDPFDFVAAYLIPEDVWYIIPAEKIRGQGSIALYPQAAGIEVWAVKRDFRICCGAELLIAFMDVRRNPQCRFHDAGIVHGLLLGVLR